MSCNLSIEEELNAEAQAQEQQPANISPTQHPLTQATPPSSHPDPTYLLTAAASVAATMQNQEDSEQTSLQIANHVTETTHVTTIDGTADGTAAASSDTNNADTQGSEWWSN